ncbi:NADP-specific glutamate dehydrogenase [Marivita sp. S6314]|uniref:NADP-specific glutamate dehydrogenase n=1 Tax=Marivita sp. S6314 TaxID=2926406 RepID=UPI001FF3B6E4|nr:NADP-specific glutamate dehydrogenase [Marivita sp. S6314]MCK0149516.1 NADP-specific glutamate dehydrogenase [Marivita sp. S6314]
MNRRDALTHAFLSDLPFDTDSHPNLVQAVEDIARAVLTVEKNNADFAAARVLRRLVDPDQIVSFRVAWEDANGEVQVNRGWRVQGSQAIGPYKGGLRFHPSVNEDILRFLAFEQCFKNALTGLPLGGAKGGSDFDPTGRSEAEIMRFCQAFMRKLAPFIGPDRDVPAGDINVGPREIGYLFGAWREQAGIYGGALTGKGLSYGGSEMRVEATGFGVVYFTQHALAEQNTSFDGKRVAISGKGNVATHAAIKAIDLGARVVALSDTSGALICEDGLSHDAVQWVQAQKAQGAGIDTPPAAYCATFKPGATPWDTEPDIALPCATQNELDGDMAQTLIDGGCLCLAEGANMPLTDDAATALREADILHIPGKAANAGGVAVSGLEMSQNSHRRFMDADTVDSALQSIMTDIHTRVAEEGRNGDRIDYVTGANIAGYRRLAKAIVAQGIL